MRSLLQNFPSLLLLLPLVSFTLATSTDSTCSTCRYAWESHDGSVIPPPIPTEKATSPSFTPFGARSSHGCSVVGSSLILFGGEKLARVPVQDNSSLWSKNLSDPASSWVLLNTEHEGITPPPRVAHTQAVVGSDLYVFGGRQGITESEAPLNDLWKFSLSNKKWSPVSISAGEPPAPRSFHKMVAVGAKLYVFGGCSAEKRLADLHSFDTETNTWAELHPGPEGLVGRGGAGFLASNDGGTLYVVGGFYGVESNAVWRFVLASRTWDEVWAEGNAEIRPFSVSCAARLGDKLVFFGGEVDPSQKGHEGAGGFTDAVLALDGVTGAVLNCTGSAEKGDGASPLGRGWAACDAWGEDRLVVVGGLTGSDAEPMRLEDTWVLTLL